MDINKAFQSTLFDKLDRQDRNNGLVNDIYKESGSAPFLDHLKAGAMQPSGQNTMGHLNVNHNLLTGNREATPISELFFSRQNIQALQDGIRYVIYKRTQKIIGQQSVHALLMIMQYVFSLRTDVRPYMFVEQVRELNGRVIEEAVRSIVNELNMYEKYLHDSSHIHVKTTDPINASAKGEKTLELKNFI